MTPDPRKVFSDEQILMAKGDLGGFRSWVSNEEVLALFARLAAAEWAMSELERHERKGYLHGDLVAPLKAWRQISGKDREGV